MNIIIGTELPLEALGWARSMMNLEGPVGPCITWSMIDEQGYFVAVFVLSDITPQSACIHFAARPGARWLTPEFVKGVMDGAFITLGVSRLTAPIRASNERSMKVASKWGFVYEGTMRHAFPNGEGCMIFSLLKDEYLNHRWYKKSKLST